VSSVAPAGVSPLRAWALAARPATLPAAAVPVIAGAAIAMSEGARFHALVFAVTLACALLIQIGTNFANDYSDFHRGADHAGRLGPVRVTQSGLISASDVRRGIIVAFGLAVILGLWLVYVGGWPILAIGVASIIAGLAYTGGPFPFGYYALGDLFVFVFFGLIAVAGTAYLQLGQWSRFSILLAIPIGLLVTNILVINNLRDLPTDRAAKKNTLAVVMGEKATRLQYMFFALAAFAIPVFIGLRNAEHRTLLLPLAVFPMALGLIQKVWKGTSGRDLNPILGKSGKLLFFFGILLSIGVVI
jgi:1,4-dihydroxy-2-naphthoate octaprenyltransferase